MKKSSNKKNEIPDLELKWDHGVKPVKESKFKPPFPARPLEEYFDFLESIGPLPVDNAPVKLYTRRFEL